MSEFSPIVYLISAIGSEIVKDVGKHLGKKIYDTVCSLREPVVELGISNYSNYEEISEKLEKNPEIHSIIGKKINDNQKEFAELVRILKEGSVFTRNNFFNENNEKVLNVGDNRGTIKM